MKTEAVLFLGFIIGFAVVWFRPDLKLPTVALALVLFLLSLPFKGEDDE